MYLILQLSYLVINKQLLDEAEHDIMNYQSAGLSYLPKHKHKAWLHSIIVLLNIFQTICKRRCFSMSMQKFANATQIRAWKLGRLWIWHDNPISAADIGLSCQLLLPLFIDCMLLTIRVSIVILMYNKIIYHIRCSGVLYRWVFLWVVCIATCPTGSSKYSISHKNTQQYFL